MLFDNNIFNKIWDLALPFQDARNDAGHGQIVTEFTEILCDLEKANKNIAVPAAILHDIGWSQLTKKERFLIFDKNNDPAERLEVRYKHQKEGVKLAQKILKRVNYTTKDVDSVLDIISEHDTREGYKTIEEAVMRDADKLWRVSKVGFYDDIKQSNITPEYYYDLLVSKLDDPKFLFLKSSKKLAQKELSIRKNEFST